MARIHYTQADLATHMPLFECSIKIRVDDINYGNHLGNHTLLAYMHEARTQWLASKGLSEANITGIDQDSNQDICGLIMLGAALDYLKQAYLHQQLNLTVSLVSSITNKHTSRFTLGYLITDCQEQTTIARGETDLCCFNYAKQKASRMPDKLRQLLTC